MIEIQIASSCGRPSSSLFDGDDDLPRSRKPSPTLDQVIHTSNTSTRELHINPDYKDETLASDLELFEPLPPQRRSQIYRSQNCRTNRADEARSVRVHAPSLNRIDHKEMFRPFPQTEKSTLFRDDIHSSSSGRRECCKKAADTAHMLIERANDMLEKSQILFGPPSQSLSDNSRKRTLEAEPIEELALTGQTLEHQINGAVRDQNNSQCGDQDNLSFALNFQETMSPIVAISYEHSLICDLVSQQTSLVSRLEFYKEEHERHQCHRNQLLLEKVSFKNRLAAMDRLFKDSLSAESKAKKECKMAEEHADSMKRKMDTLIAENQQLVAHIVPMKNRHTLAKAVMKCQGNEGHKISGLEVLLRDSRDQSNALVGQLLAQDSVLQDLEYSFGVILSLVTNPRSRASPSEESGVACRLREELKQLRSDSSQQIESQRSSHAREVWTKDHLIEEGKRALAMSQKLHKESIEAGAESKKFLEQAELRLKLEKECTERLLGDKMRACAVKDDEIAMLRKAIASGPRDICYLAGKNLDLSKQLNAARVANDFVCHELKEQSDLRVAAEGKVNALEQLALQQDTREGRTEVELNRAQEETEHLQKRIKSLVKELDTAQRSLEEWRNIATKKLMNFKPENADQVEESLVQCLQDDISHLNTLLSEARVDVQRKQVDLEYLEFDNYLHNHRLQFDEEASGTHWYIQYRQVRNENEALRTRFKRELEQEPL